MIIEITSITDRDNETLEAEAVYRDDRGTARRVAWVNVRRADLSPAPGYFRAIFSVVRYRHRRTSTRMLRAGGPGWKATEDLMRMFWADAVKRFNAARSESGLHPILGAADR